MNHKLLLLMPLMLAAVVLGIVPSAPPASADPVVEVSGVRITTELTGMKTAVAVREAGNGRIYASLKRGDVMMYDGPGDTTPTVAVDLSRETHSAGDRGMLGLELDPGFLTGRPYLYVLYMYNKDPFGTAEVPRWYTGDTDVCPTPPGLNDDGCTVTARLDRFTIGAGGLSVPGSRVSLLDGVTDPHGGYCFQFPSHGIGTVKFGPDGALYVGAGEGANFNAADYGQFGGRLAGSPTPANPCNDGPSGRGTALTAATSHGGALRSQAARAATDTGFVSWGGAILRVDPDTGAALPDNPLVGNGRAGDDRIVAYGLRNPFRFNFRPGTDELWLGDVGWSRFDEINRFPTGPGQTTVPNFGWPCREGTIRQPTYDSADINLCESLYANPSSDLGGVSSPLVEPYFSWPHDDVPLPAPGCAATGGVASVGGVFLTGNQWPAELRNAYVFADYARGCIAYLPAGPDGEPDSTQPRTLVSGTYAVDLQIGADGALYWTDIAFNTMHRMEPTGSGNQAPTASFTATPQQGDIPLTVSLDASGSTDPEGDALTYAWDLDGDGACDDASGETTSHTYTEAATVLVKLCVSDTAGGLDTDTVVVTPGGASPTITQLTANTRIDGFKVDDPITFTAAATEASGAGVPASGFAWTFELRHCENEIDDASCHSHIVDEINGTKTATIRAPDHEYYSYVRARLTVTGATGLESTQALDAKPRISTITLKTSPTGIPVSNGLQSGASPVSAKFAWGGVAQLLVPAQVTLAGKNYRFSGWSDGSTAGPQRDLTVPKVNTSRTAKYVSADAPPVVESASVSPTAVTGLPATFQGSSRVTDDVGVSSVRFRMTDPAGKNYSTLLTRIAGTALDGTWSGSLRLPSTAIAGEYRTAMLAKDTAGRQVTRNGQTVVVTR